MFKVKSKFGNVMAKNVTKQFQPDGTRRDKMEQHRLIVFKAKMKWPGWKETIWTGMEWFGSEWSAW